MNDLDLQTNSLSNLLAAQSVTARNKVASTTYETMYGIVQGYDVANNKVAVSLISNPEEVVNVTPDSGRAENKVTVNSMSTEHTRGELQKGVEIGGVIKMDRLTKVGEGEYTSNWITRVKPLKDEGAVYYGFANMSVHTKPQRYVDGQPPQMVDMRIAQSHLAASQNPLDNALAHILSKAIRARQPHESKFYAINEIASKSAAILESTPNTPQTSEDEIRKIMTSIARSSLPIKDPDVAIEYVQRNDFTLVTSLIYPESERQIKSQEDLRLALTDMLKSHKNSPDMDYVPDGVRQSVILRAKQGDSIFPIEVKNQFKVINDTFQELPINEQVNKVMTENPTVQALIGMAESGAIELSAMQKKSLSTLPLTKQRMTNEDYNALYLINRSHTREGEQVYAKSLVGIQRYQNQKHDVDKSHVVDFTHRTPFEFSNTAATLSSLSTDSMRAHKSIHLLTSNAQNSFAPNAMQQQAVDQRQPMQQQAVDQRQPMQQQAVDQRQPMQQQAVDQRQPMQQQAVDQRQPMQQQADDSATEALYDELDDFGDSDLGMPQQAVSRTWNPSTKKTRVAGRKP